MFVIKLSKTSLETLGEPAGQRCRITNLEKGHLTSIRLLMFGIPYVSDDFPRR